MRYNLITLDLFLCASKYKSLVKAAKEKNLVVSAVSKRILDLEKSVGVNLFYRKKTGVELTPAGLEMQKHCILEHSHPEFPHPCWNQSIK